MPPYFTKPEDALKKASGFIFVGKKELALDELYNSIRCRRTRTWQKTHEQILTLYLKLCVELRRSTDAKDALHQYKQICQQVNINSLEEVIKQFLHHTEEVTEKARLESREQVTVEDLDQLETPETILLKSVSDEGKQERTDRVMLLPWVKFLWEAYRNVLELLKNNVNVEKLYHIVARLAFKFCLKYNRKAEFRRLCEQVQKHLHNQMHTTTSINPNDSSSIVLQLDTRLEQLETAIEMDLWQEAYKAVKDRFFLAPSRKTSPAVQASYFQKMALVLWTGDNMLFHAATILKLFTLYRDQKKNANQDELAKWATAAVMAALATPIMVETRGIERMLDRDHASYERARTLSGLIGLTSVPTRSSLMKDIVKMGVLNFVQPEIQQLFNLLEEGFSPLSLCKSVNDVLETIKLTAKDDLVKYTKPIRDTTVVRFLQQISQVYSSVMIDRLLELVPFVDAVNLERIMVSCMHDGLVHLLIDHHSRLIRFSKSLGPSSAENSSCGTSSEVACGQLYDLMEGIPSIIHRLDVDKLQRKLSVEMAHLVQVYQEECSEEHKQLLNRRFLTDMWTKRLEQVKQETEKEQYNKQKQQEERLKEKERVRQEEERKKREEDHRRREEQEVQKRIALDRLLSLKETEFGRKHLNHLTTEDLGRVNPDELMASHLKQLDKEMKETATKLRAQEKKVDHLARAVRLEEIPLIRKYYEEKVIQDREIWEQQEEERVAQAIQDHELAVANKERVARMLDDYNAYLEKREWSQEQAFQEKWTAFELKLAEARAVCLEERKRERMQVRKEQKVMEFIEKRKAEKVLIKEKEQAEKEKAASREKGKELDGPVVPVPEEKAALASAGSEPQPGKYVAPKRRTERDPVERAGMNTGAEKEPPVPKVDKISTAPPVSEVPQSGKYVPPKRRAV